MRLPCGRLGIAMTTPYLLACLMQEYAATVQSELLLSLGDGLKGLPSCPTWL